MVDVEETYDAILVLLQAYYIFRELSTSLAIFVTQCMPDDTLKTLSKNDFS